MSVNLIEILKNAFNDNAYETLSQKVGDNVNNIKSGVSAIIPTVLASILGKNHAANYSPEWWTPLTHWYGAEETDALKVNLFEHPEFATHGTTLLSNLFSDNRPQVENAISKVSGMNTDKVSALLKASVPMIIGYLTNWLQRKGWTFADLIANLKENKSALISALPAGIGMDSFGLNADMPNIPHEYDKKQLEAPTSQNNWLKWLIPLLLLIVLLWFLLGKGCKKQDVVTTTDTITMKIDSATKDMAAQIKGKLNEFGDWVADLGNEFKLKLKNNTELNVFENSVETRLVKFIEDDNKEVDKTTWFSFDRLYFESGKSQLKPESQQQLKNIAAIMNAYPKVKIKLGGYTDNTGSNEGNVKLSADRAKAAMNELVKLGVAKTRMEAEGYGSQYPICPANDTPECKAQNRRIDIRVTEK